MGDAFGDPCERVDEPFEVVIIGEDARVAASNFFKVDSTFLVVEITLASFPILL